MKKIIFTGVATALITPFKDGNTDFEALGKIIDIQIKNGCDALVVAGTTGEAATLSESERLLIFEFCKERTGCRLPLIFGTGTNDTRESIHLAREAERIGADGILTVTPYYNKGTDEGVIRHYLSIADATDLPIILYNVPKRTGTDLKISLIRRLAECERIVGIKEAGDSVDRLTQLAAMSKDLALYSGNDSQIYATLALGGAGVISVASNAIPKQIKAICETFKNDGKEALGMQNELLPFIDALFLETNPTPIKYAMHLLGHCRNEVRLPLAPACKKTKRAVHDELLKISNNSDYCI